MMLSIGLPSSLIKLACSVLWLLLLLFSSASAASTMQQQPHSVMAAAAAAASGSAADNAELNNNKYFPPAAAAVQQEKTRNDGEYRTCVLRYQVNMETIIRTQDSRALGAKYINETELPSQEDCLLWCCQTDACNVAIFEKKDRGSCYLFDCGPPTDFKCKFAPHHLYMSAILDMSNLEHDPGYNHHPYTSYSHNNKGVGGAPVDEHIAALKNLKHEQMDEAGAFTGRPAAPPPPPPALEVTVRPQPTPAPAGPQTTASPAAQQGASGLRASNGAEVGAESSDGGVVNGVVRCSHFQFQCRTTKECIAVYNACDGIPQCGDGSDEGDELGCPTEGRRYGQQQQQTVESTSTSPNGHHQMKPSMDTDEHNSKRPSSNVDVERHLSIHQQDVDQQPFARANKVGVDEQHRYQYNGPADNNNAYQQLDSTHQQWQQQQQQSIEDNSRQTGSQSAVGDVKHHQQQQQQQRPMMVAGHSSGQQQRLHQMTNERTHYNDGGRSFQRVEQQQVFDQEQLSKSRPNVYDEDNVKNQHMYNGDVQQQPMQQPQSVYNEESELVDQPSAYDSHHYDVGPQPQPQPQQPPPRTYMKEYYEGGGAYQPHYKNNGPSQPHQPQQQQQQSSVKDNQEMFSHEKGPIKDTNNGWSSNSNRYDQQQQMYEGRSRTNMDNYQYPVEPEVHVHVDSHPVDMSQPHRSTKLNTQDKHIPIYNNEETLMNPVKGQLDNWSQGQPIDQHVAAQLDRQQTSVQTVQKSHDVDPASVAATTTTTTTTTTTHQPSSVTASPLGHNSKQVSSSVVAVKSMSRVHELDIAEVDAVHAQRSSESSGAIVALTLGLSITGLLLVLVGCRLRMVRRRLRKGRSYAHDADYLVNGMYL